MYEGPQCSFLSSLQLLLCLKSKFSSQHPGLIHLSSLFFLNASLKFHAHTKQPVKLKLNLIVFPLLDDTQGDKIFWNECGRKKFIISFLPSFLPSLPPSLPPFLPSFLPFLSPPFLICYCCPTPLLFLFVTVPQHFICATFSDFF
jgi:hypothetical protein